ncbi:MAG TPA: penicillin-binding protein 2 [Solirubrobacteraceae bacterium]|nr:penicillin-binding protein 2 [Solirubrobacteraceae bacterium]
MLVERRIGLLRFGFLGLLTIAALQALYLGVVKGPSLRQAARSQQVAVANVPAPRGAITDRRGADLAVSQAAADIAVTPYLIKDPARAAQRLAPLLATTPQTLLPKLVRHGTGFVYLARLLPAGRAKQIAALRLPGVQLIPTTRRIYPRHWLGSQLIGAVGTDGTGLAGLEYSRERTLHGHDGARREVKDALGRAISLRDTSVARPGATLRLTLDAPIQDKVESVLGEVAQRYHPKGATALVMDPRTGALMALANWPRVDANKLGAAPPYARQDRAVGAAYEPGSTFKAFTVAGALEDHRVTPQTQFDLPPQIQVADRTIGESHPRGAVTLTTAQILAQSSNIGAIKIGLSEGKRRFDYWVRRFGFGRSTGIDLPGEGTGIVPRLDQYSGSSMGNLPIGQGLAVTPLQMATGYAAIANGGILRPAHIVDAVDGKRTPIPPGHRVLSAGTARSLRRMLEGVLAPGGTASEAAIPGYRLAGKTGTANKPEAGGYSKTRFVASFVGFAPARDPQLLVAVMVDEPQGQIYGGLVAAPAFQEITSFALPYLRIPPG